MDVSLHADPDSPLDVTVHTTFDETDGQYPQPWRVYVEEIRDTIHVESGTEDQLVTLPAEGIYTFHVSSNTSSAEVKYATGEQGLVEPEPVLPITIDAFAPDLVDGDLTWDVTLTGSGFDGSNEAGSYAVMACFVLDKDPTNETTSGGGTVVDGSTYTATFGFIPLGTAAGDTGVLYTKDAMMAESSNRIPFTVGAAPAVPMVITSVDPPGAAAGLPTLVTLYGTGLSQVTAVDFLNNGPATDYNIINDTVVDVTTPAGVLGAGDITVTDASGGTATTPFTFTTAAP